MPVKTNSGHLLPTDEYLALYCTPDVPDIPTMQIPAISRQFKKPTGVWRPPVNAVLCDVQTTSYHDQHRTYFGMNGRKYAVDTAPADVLCSFLDQHGYDMDDYEYRDNPWEMRRDALNTLLMQGKLRILRALEEPALQFFLAPPLSCCDLAKEFLWSTKYCCPDCHGIGGMLGKYTLTDRREAMVCCRACDYLLDYPRLHATLPPCEWHDPGGPPTEEFNMSLLD